MLSLGFLGYKGGVCAPLSMVPQLPCASLALGTVKLLPS